ncbi:cytosine permease [Cellulomonas shaoxiangyii]|uniref:Cytosine permease n=1 Tax=Cellulomonas shaoxiangyii TaxID=2566013 RepID=A0A4P7SJ89_9CELL|nr:cytosine permease [Cellulomonas shaoxiangyii]QCB94150.1 cytosine permease [Cellulomonas shaoxiangyii]TGY86643.1 cytosine permease [Cellulomonas shaoxiangyii]
MPDDERPAGATSTVTPADPTATTPTAPAVHADAEFENAPVPADRRRGVLSVSAVWAGFPLILTSALTGATLVNGLGFQRGALAMVLGNLLLFVYVGTLGALSARTGHNFSLQASRTLGSKGYVAASGLLSTLVLGWFAVQTGLVGSSVTEQFDVSGVLVTVVAGALFTVGTLAGIRALTVIGAISVPLFLVLGVVATMRAATDGGAVWNYAGTGDALALGAGVSLVFALFADSGTMAADFNRWSRSPRQAWVSVATAFPVGCLVAMLLGGVVAAATAGAGDTFGVLTGMGGAMPAIAVVLLFVNLGSVCMHCLYNAAVGWSNLTRRTMRQATVVLGALGIVLAVAGIADHFVDWLNLLGVIVPPIGAVLIVDQALLAARRRVPPDAASPAVRWQAFAAWGVGSLCALLAQYLAPGLSAVVVGLVTAGLGYALITRATTPTTTAA